ncbi:hypothetical protein GCM10027403_07610 [Arthrobacter tecti]
MGSTPERHNQKAPVTTATTTRAVRTHTFAAGTAVYGDAPENSLADATATFVNADEEFAEICLAGHDLSLLLQGIQDGALEPERLADVVIALTENGYLTSETHTLPPFSTIAILGDGQLAEHLAELLSASPCGWDVQRNQANASLTIAAADNFADSWLTDVDNQTQRQNSALLTAFCEQGTVAFGPLRLARQSSPGYTDLRFRRLTAHVAPEALAGLWNAYDDDARLLGAGPPAVRPAMIALASHIIAEALATPEGRDRLVGTQHVVHRDLQITRHPVLIQPQAMAQ